jgi:hypothetical protein
MAIIDTTGKSLSAAVGAVTIFKLLGVSKLTKPREASGMLAISTNGKMNDYSRII